MRNTVIVRGLGKHFYRYHANQPVTLKQAVLSGLRHLKPAEPFWALRDISFSVAPGHMLGVIGTNGAGKSTLLRLLGGVGRPDKGSVKVNGRIGALLDLGAGFHPDLTGRENVFVGGIVAGLTRKQVAQRFDSIVEFAELQSFIDNPLRTYSTGMQMRLAFAVAVHTEPDVLLIDEFLSVGDLSFQSKCLERIAQFKAQGCAIVLVSHNAEQIQQLCDEALWLRNGQVVAYGEPEVVAGQYIAEMRSETQRRTPVEQPAVLTPSGAELRVNENRFGSLDLEIIDVRLLDSKGFAITELESGDSLRIEIKYQSHQSIYAPIFGVTISQEDGLPCYDTNTKIANLSLPFIQQGQGRIALELKRLDLKGGKYFVDVGVYERDWAYAYDYHWHVYPLLVRSNASGKGILYPPHHWRMGGVKVPSL